MPVFGSSMSLGPHSAKRVCEPGAIGIADLKLEGEAGLGAWLNNPQARGPRCFFGQLP